MAQLVKKLQGGGYFTWNGEQVEATDENIAKIAAISPEAALLAKSGQLKSLNPDGTVVTNTRVKAKDKRKIRQNLTPLRLLSFGDSNSRSTSSGSDKKYKLDVSKDINLTFDENGKLLDTPESRRYKSRLRGYLNGWKGEKQYSDYDFGGRYYDIDDANAFWGDAKTKAHFANLDEVFARIEAGEANDQDIAYLKAAGINYGSNPARDSKKADKKAMADLGMTEDMWNQAKDHITYDSKSGLYTLSNDVKSALGLSNDSGYEFNDSWAKKMNNPRWNWLKGLSLVGGNLYKNDSEGVSSWRGNTDYDKLSKAYDVAGANNIYRTIWDDNELKAANAHAFVDRDTLYNEWFSSADRKNTMYNVLSGIKKATGFKDVKGGHQEWNDDHQIIRHWDKNDPSKIGYAIFDKNGKYLGDADESTIVSDDRNTYRDFYHGTDPNTTGTFSRIQQDGDYKGMVQIGVDSKIGDSGIKMYFNPDDPNSVILDLGWDHKSNSAGKAFKIPAEVAEKFKNNPDLLKKLATQPQLLRRLARSLNDMGTSAWQEFWDWSNRADVKDYKALGFSDTEAKEIDDIIRQYGDRTTYDDGGLNAGAASKRSRIGQHLASRFRNEPATVPSNKLGGILKAQAGAKTVKVDEVDDPNKAWGLGAGDSKTMSSADWADLTALITDIGGTALAFVPGANIASAATGAAGSTAGFIADITRDGFQGSDLGKYAVNLGLDAATLLPFVGGAAKVGKVAKAIKNAAPLLIKGAAVLGLSDAVVNTIKKAVSGESFTINDVRHIVQGFSGGLALHRTGLKTPGKKAGALRDADAFTIKAKDKNVANVRLNKKEIESVTSLAPDKQKEKLAEIVLEHVKKGNANTKLTKETVLDAFEAVPTARIRGELTWDPRKWTGEGYQFKAADTFDYNANIRTDRSKLGAWFHGDDPMRMAYNRYLRTGAVPGGNLRAKNGQFKSAMWSAPVFNLPGFTSSDGETDPRTYADVHVPAVTYHEGGSILSPNLDDLNLGEMQDRSGTGEYSFGPSSAKKLGAAALGIELAGNIANLGISIGHTNKQYKDTLKNNSLAAKAVIASATPHLKSMPVFDNSNNDRQLDSAKKTIYNPVDNITDPIVANQIKKGQTEQYLKSLDNYYNNTSRNVADYNQKAHQVGEDNRAAEQQFGNTVISTGLNQKIADNKAKMAKTEANMTSAYNAVKGFTSFLSSGLKNAAQMNALQGAAAENAKWNNDLTSRWNDLIANKKLDYAMASKYKDDIEGYLQANDAQWYNGRHAMYQNALINNARSVDPFASMGNYPHIPIAVLQHMPVKPTVDVHRRGGRLPAEDILWIEKNKNAAKTIAKLHEDILKLLKVGK